MKKSKIISSIALVSAVAAGLTYLFKWYNDVCHKEDLKQNHKKSHHLTDVFSKAKEHAVVHE